MAKLLHSITGLLLLLLGLLALAGCGRETAVSPTAAPVQPTTPLCQPTLPDALGPFYVPNAPVRGSVGQGYLLEGAVLDGATCRPILDAQVEFWLVGPDGEYGDDYRATVFVDGNGRYRFESHFPPPYEGRPSHIHIRVTAEGHQLFVTQHYPEAGASGAIFDLVLTNFSG